MQLSLLEARERFEEIRRLSGEGWWERYEALPESDRPTDCRDVACPKCGVGVGVKCRRPSGHSPQASAHAERWDLVLAEAEARTLSNRNGGRS